jgi:hypothetical protein
MKTKKTFDCVQMTREIRNKIYEENKGRSREELIQYYASLKKETLVLREDNGKYGNNATQKPKS